QHKNDAGAKLFWPHDAMPCPPLYIKPKIDGLPRLLRWQHYCHAAQHYCAIGNGNGPEATKAPPPRFMEPKPPSRFMEQKFTLTRYTISEPKFLCAKHLGALLLCEGYILI
ncbi:MAG TPA: hypothetical protein VLA24_16595, partial [Pseudomonadales bacterium]|nr:hypothetical protein [Pseudomonadales bacterium]